MIEPHADRPWAITLGADKNYDAEDFVNQLDASKNPCESLADLIHSVVLQAESEHGRPGAGFFRC